MPGRRRTGGVAGANKWKKEGRTDGDGVRPRTPTSGAGQADDAGARTGGGEGMENSKVMSDE